MLVNHMYANPKGCLLFLSVTILTRLTSPNCENAVFNVPSDVDCGSPFTKIIVKGDLLDSIEELELVQQWNLWRDGLGFEKLGDAEMDIFEILEMFIVEIRFSDTKGFEIAEFLWHWTGEIGDVDSDQNRAIKKP